MENVKSKISLTGVLIKDPSDGGFTSYLAEMPEVIAEGNTEEEAIDNLFQAMKVIFDFNKEESMDDFMPSGYSTKSFDLELA